MALSEVRERTLALVAQPGTELNAAALERRRPSSNTVGSLLYHIAGTELDWLYNGVLKEPFPAASSRSLPLPACDDTGRLSEVTGLSLDDHLLPLERVRAALLEASRAMSLEDFRSSRALADYEVTPEWVLVP